MYNILVVEEDVGSCHQMVQALIDSGYEAEMASNAKEAIGKIERNNYDLILTQLASAQVDGYHILKKAKAKNKTTIIIVITDNEESHAAFEAINRGGHGFIEKPFSSPQLILEVREALEKRSLSYDLDYLRHQQDWRKPSTQDVYIHRLEGRQDRFYHPTHRRNRCGQGTHRWAHPLHQFEEKQALH
jgi:DNA-binding NtrC family response regulator